MNLERRIREFRMTVSKRFPTVTMHLRARAGVAVLQLLSIPVGERGRGQGSRVLESLCDWADRADVTLALSPDGAFGMDPRRLAHWYGRYGFSPGETAGQRLVRRPREWLIGVPRTDTVAA